MNAEEPHRDADGYEIMPDTELCDADGIIVKGPGVGWPCTGSAHIAGTITHCSSTAHRPDYLQ